MIHLHEHRYDYQEELNDGIVAELPFVAPPKPVVLDVGCGGGALGEAIRSRGYEVWGIEVHPEAVRLAADRLDGVVAADLNDLPKVRALLGDRRFDALIFSDVLEHVYDPFTRLKEYLEFLKPGGRVLVSLPNVAVWASRLSLLVGRFEYSDTGIMDRTHVRFFTFRSAKRLVTAAGLEIEKVSQTPFFVRAALPLIKLFLAADAGQGLDRRKIARSSAYKLYMKLVYPVEHFIGGLWKSLFAFRIIIVARKP
jgi:2-polyprenyl-3-methyl-5-hydroxy-6-metoxy-1,4-benzoquinol methylase